MSAPDNTAALCAIECDDLGLAVVKASGRWKLLEGLPDLDALVQDLERYTVKTLRVDASSVNEWDSTLPTLVLKCEHYCKGRSIQMEEPLLPEGVEAILDLAKAAPEAQLPDPAGCKGFLCTLGDAAMELWRSTIEVLQFLGETVFSFVRLFRGKARFRTKDFILVLQQCGADALPIVTLISFLVGFTLAFVGAVQLGAFGADIYVANLVGLGMVREMGAMMAAIIMCGRSGAAFASHIGSMKVSEEIDALQTLGISPMDFLVMPRMVALFLMMPLLSIYADFIGIFGGITVGMGMLDLSYTQYIKQTQSAITIVDFSTGVIKSTVFGALVVATGCLRGMQCGNSSAAVGAAATSAVVSGITAIIIADSVFTMIFNALGM